MVLWPNMRYYNYKFSYLHDTIIKNSVTLPPQLILIQLLLLRNYQKINTTTATSTLIALGHQGVTVPNATADLEAHKRYGDSHL